jgi:hypothetical protein
MSLPAFQSVSQDNIIPKWTRRFFALPKFGIASLEFSPLQHILATVNPSRYNDPAAGFDHEPT